MAILQQFGQYRVEASLGSDRYSEAYRAVDTVRRRTVMLRLLRSDELGDAAALKRFVQQAQRAADLVHPRLAWVWDVGEAEGRHYLIERFVSGPTLTQQLAENGPLGWEQAQTAITQIAQGLDFAHGRGIDLGAVCPRNIVLSQELGAVLCGLGLALGLPPNRSIEDRDDALYAAPELWQRRPPSPASDQYALACVLAEMLSGRALFAAPSIEAIHARHLEELQLPHTWPAGTPWQVELALERALSKEPGERYANSTEFAETPGKLALRSSGDEGERERRAALAQARKQAEEQAHRVAEEAARLAALEQARQELEEQVRHPEPISDASASPVQPDDEPSIPIDVAEPHQTVDRVDDGRTAGRRRNITVWVIGVILIFALAAVWLSGRLAGVGPLAATATPTFTTTATSTSTPTSSPTPTASLTPTASATASTTPTITRTATRTSTPTPRPTATQTQRPIPNTATPEPVRERDND